MIGLLIYIIILLMIFGLLIWAVDLILPMPANMRMLVKALLVVVLVLILLDILFGARIGGPYLPRYPAP